MNNLCSNVGTLTQQKEMKRRLKIENFLNEQTNLDSITEECNTCNEKSLLESALNSMKSNRRTNSVLLNEKAELDRKDNFDALCETFSNIVLKSLLIEQELIDVNREEIINKSKGLLNEMMEDINSSNVLVEELISNTYKDEEILNESLLLEGYDIDDSLEGQVASIIKEKDIDVIRDEKILAEAFTLLESGNLDGVEAYDTVFRKLQVENIKLALKENKEASKDDIMAIAFYESIVDYTILESLNTIQALDFRDDLFRVSRRSKRNLFEF